MPPMLTRSPCTGFTLSRNTTLGGQGGVFANRAVINVDLSVCSAVRKLNNTLIRLCAQLALLNSLWSFDVPYSGAS